MKSSLESCSDKHKNAQLYAKVDNWADLNVNRVRQNAFEMVSHGEDGECRILEQSGCTEPSI